MEKNKLLALLPPFRNNSVLIHDDQSVNDIVNEVLQSHELFAKDYDSIAENFCDNDVYNISEKLFNFCKQNIRYRIETEKQQTSRSPAATLAIGTGDCKHYAGFIAGVLDALNRQGEKIKWTYRFASYTPMDKEPQHVFVVVKDNGREIWIDPVLDYFNEKNPKPDYYFDEKPYTMALHRLSGIPNTSYELIGPVDLGPNPNIFWWQGEWYKWNNNRMGDVATPGGIDPISLATQATSTGFHLFTNLISSIFGKDTHRAAQKIFEIFPVPNPATAESLLEIINAINAHWQVDKTTADSEWTNAYADALRQYTNAYKLVAAGQPMPTIVKPPEGQLSFTTLPPGVPVASGSENTYGTNLLTTGTGGIMDWIKSNPLIAIGGAFLIYKLVLSKR